MTKFKKETLLEIDNVRIIRSDPYNLAIEKRETVYSPITKSDSTKYRNKGYYGTILGALRAIQYKELLMDENSVTDLNGHLKQVEESNGKVLKLLEDEKCLLS